MAVDQSDKKAGPAWAFPIKPGSDQVVQLHQWLAGLQNSHAIGDWYPTGVIADHRGTRALIEFDDPSDGDLALSEWNTR